MIKRHHIPLSEADEKALSEYERESDLMNAATRESGYDPADWEDGIDEWGED